MDKWVKNPLVMQEIPGLGRFPGGVNGNPLQYSCLENPSDREAWQAEVHRVAKNHNWSNWEHTYTVKLSGLGVLCVEKVLNYKYTILMWYRAIQIFYFSLCQFWKCVLCKELDYFIFMREHQGICPLNLSCLIDWHRLVCVTSFLFKSYRASPSFVSNMYFPLFFLIILGIINSINLFNIPTFGFIDFSL